MFRVQRLQLSDCLIETDQITNTHSTDSLQFKFRNSHICRSPFASVSASGVESIKRPRGLFATVATKPQKTKAKNFRVVKVAGDGRCMFRALAKGLAYNQGIYLSGEAETEDADELRMAVYEAICSTPQRQADFKEALVAIKSEYDLKHYCEHIRHAGFWGGESELLVLSKMLKVPLVVYLSGKELKRGGGGYSPLVTYGKDFVGKRKPVRLLYGGGNHYDLLLPS